MKFPVRIALRYIFKLRSFQFITVISTISLIGIIVGIAAIICVSSIFNGFREFTEDQLISFDPHIRLIPKDGAMLKNPDLLLLSIKNIPEISAASPVIQGRIIILKGTDIQVVILNAVQEKEIPFVSGIKEKIIIGRFNLSDTSELSRIVVGAGISEKLKIFPGDTIALLSPANIEKAYATLNLHPEIYAKVSGIFQTNAKEYDATYVYASDNIGKKLFRLSENSAYSIDLRLSSIQDVDKVKIKLEKLLSGENVIVQTWYDLHKDLYNIMQLERYSTFVILSLIIVIAIFNVLASLTMTVIEKRSDIALIKALGGTKSDIQNIYLAEGLIIGLIATFLGTALGLGLCYGQIYFHWFQLDPSKFLIPAIPVSVYTSDIIIAVLLSLVLSVFAAILPARRAADTNIAEALRNE